MILTYMNLQICVYKVLGANQQSFKKDWSPFCRLESNSADETMFGISHGNGPSLQ